MMRIKSEFSGLLVAFILFVPTNALAGFVDGEPGVESVAQIIIAQSDTGEIAVAEPEEKNEDEEEPDCE